MFIEIHAIQNFAPSNLNRDDTGSPKDCEFGGHRRARVSSQCWKRAVREYFSQEDLIPEAPRAIRTKRLVDKVASMLFDTKPTTERTLEQATAVAAGAIEALGVGYDAKKKETSVLLFVGGDEIQALVSLCNKHWNLLLAESNKKIPKPDTAVAQQNDQIPSDSKKKKSGLPKAIITSLKYSLSGSRAVDLALFGRMIAEDKKLNVDAACQVAHALSTHRVAPEFDYFTAVEEINREDQQGAGMIGTQEFNSACFYRYANINLKQLQSNLPDDRELALEGTRAFLQSFIMSIPKAKQNSTAAQNLPSFVMIVVRDKGLASLANAFVRPVDGDKKGLMVNSVEALAKYWVNLKKMYGANGIKSAFYSMIEEGGSEALTDDEMAKKADSIQDLLNKAILGLGGA
jgi:CRISPR system Cascade subunit CasC